MNTSTDDLRVLDEQAFGARVEPHRRELHVHCYRLLGSFEEAEDLVQEAFLRAWRRRETYEGRSSVRAWLYRIATNACLDALDKRPRQPSPDGEVAWLQPYPDDLLAQLPDRREGPEDVALARETVELAFIAAIQHLAPLRRAVLVLRDVLGCSAKETARLLETTVASVNSALQRARAGLRERLPEDREAWQPAAAASAAERELVARYVECSERVDAEGLAALLHEDVRFSMPPTPGVWTGRRAVVQGWIDGGFGSDAFGSLRCVVTRANGQPAVAAYVRKPGEVAYEPLAIDVLRVQDGVVTEIVTFDGALFEHFELPATIAAVPSDGAGGPGEAADRG
jgi:RNA polymerase sigma-70 factor (TIGR02960 family)